LTTNVDNSLTIILFRYVKTKKVESPDVAMGIHPGLHAEGVYEYWEPTLLLLLREMTSFSFPNTTFKTKTII
jgi:hypothetical protein